MSSLFHTSGFKYLTTSAALNVYSSVQSSAFRLIPCHRTPSWNFTKSFIAGLFIQPKRNFSDKVWIYSLLRHIKREKPNSDKLSELGFSYRLRLQIELFKLWEAYLHFCAYIRLLFYNVVLMLQMLPNSSEYTANIIHKFQISKFINFI